MKNKKENRFGGNDNIMQLGNENEENVYCVKVYGAPILEVTYFYGNDVITASNSNDNNFEDPDEDNYWD